MNKYSRREITKLMSLGTASLVLVPSLLSFKTDTIIKRKIPSSDELLPIVGLGTWQTFDVGNDLVKRKSLLEVLAKMNELGGTVIDSSPMYGTSESVVGDLTNSLKTETDFFYATKVWIQGKQQGIDQMQASFRKMKRNVMDLMQIHNLVDWKTHIKTLKAWKEEGKIRYWGLTHYTNASHETLATLIKNEKPDFVQFNYSINERNAEKRLLNIAHDNNVAVIINRPYDGGNLFRSIRGKNLPNWCAEIDINSWGQFFLKYILGNKAVTCVIPGTSKPIHVADNLMAGHGQLPDDKQRKLMLEYLRSL